MNESVISLAEARAEKSGKASDWTPRDAVAAMLRDMDSGKIKADELLIIYAEYHEPGVSTTHFSNATSQSLIAFGLVERFKQVFTK